MKYLLPRKIYYRTRTVGNGWIGISKKTIVIAGYGFWKTLLFLVKWRKDE
jgi:hypothetical protein